MYNRLIEVANKQNDQGTADLLKKLLKDEESHVDGLEEQEGKIKDMDYTNLFNSVESVIRGSIFSPVTARVASRN